MWKWIQEWKLNLHFLVEPTNNAIPKRRRHTNKQPWPRPAAISNTKPLSWTEANRRCPCTIISVSERQTVNQLVWALQCIEWMAHVRWSWIKAMHPIQLRYAPIHQPYRCVATTKKRKIQKTCFTLRPLCLPPLASRIILVAPRIDNRIEYRCIQIIHQITRQHMIDFGDRVDFNVPTE